MTQNCSSAVRVNPLVWRQNAHGIWYADSILGEYSVGFDDGWWAQADGRDPWEWEPAEDPRRYSGPSAGMAACEAHYQARILSAFDTA